jgi:hypothetical protein
MKIKQKKRKTPTTRRLAPQDRNEVSRSQKQMKINIKNLAHPEERAMSVTPRSGEEEDSFIFKDTARSQRQEEDFFVFNDTIEGPRAPADTP